MEEEQTNWAVPCCLPLIPTTHACARHPLQRLNRSKSRSLSPQRRVSPGQPRKTVMNLDAVNKREEEVSWGNRSAMSTSAGLCGGTNPLPLALQRYVHASLRKTWIERKKKKIDPIKLKNTHTRHSMLLPVNSCCTLKKRPNYDSDDKER